MNSQHKVNGWTALHWAAKRNNLQCVEALLSRGADKMLFTSKGELAAHLTTNRNVLQVLGYSGHHTRERQRKRSQQQATETGATAEVRRVGGFSLHEADKHSLPWLERGITEDPDAEKKQRSEEASIHLGH